MYAFLQGTVKLECETCFCKYYPNWSAPGSFVTECWFGIDARPRPCQVQCFDVDFDSYFDVFMIEGYRNEWSAISNRHKGGGAMFVSTLQKRRCRDCFTVRVSRSVETRDDPFSGQAFSCWLQARLLTTWRFVDSSGHVVTLTNERASFEMREMLRKRPWWLTLKGLNSIPDGTLGFFLFVAGFVKPPEAHLSAFPGVLMSKSKRE
jgi:hypothetical protein